MPLTRMRGVVTSFSNVDGDEHAYVRLDGVHPHAPDRRVSLDVFVDDVLAQAYYLPEVEVLFDGTTVVAVTSAATFRYPHCDPRVLHAPDDGCEYCNAHPDWQRLRETWNIAFTGHSDDKGKTSCPAEVARPLGKIERWSGNRVAPALNGACRHCGVNDAEAHMTGCPSTRATP